MKKKMLIIIPIIIVIIVLIILLLLKNIIFGPSVSFNDKKQITEVVEKYLINKYGDHNYKITDIRYDYKMNTVFDYSNPVGYFVDCKSDEVKHFYAYIADILPNNISVDHDSLIEEYLFPNLDGYDQKEKIDELAPVDKIKEKIINDLRNVDPDIELIKNIDIRFRYPINSGKMPTEEDLKENTSYYDIIRFTYTRKSEIINDDEYINIIQEYIKNTYGVEWNISINKNGSVTCS